MVRHSKGKAKPKEKKDRKPDLNQPTLKKFGQSRKAKPDQHPIVIVSDEEEDNAPPRKRGKSRPRKQEVFEDISIEFEKPYEGRFEMSEGSSGFHTDHTSHSSGQPEDGSYSFSDSSDNWKPEGPKRKARRTGKRRKQRHYNAGGTLALNAGKSKACSPSDLGESKKPPTVEHLQEAEDLEASPQTSKKRPLSARAKQKRKKQQLGNEATLAVESADQPGQGMSAEASQLARKKSPFFASGSSEAVGSLKALKTFARKGKPLNELSRSPKAAMATGATAAAPWPSGSKVASAKARKLTQSPLKLRPAGSSKDPPQSPSVLESLQTMPAVSPNATGREMGPAGNGQSSGPIKPDVAARIQQIEKDSAHPSCDPGTGRVEDKNMRQPPITQAASNSVGSTSKNRVLVSSEGEGGPSPDPSSVAVEASRSCQGSQRSEQSPSFHTAGAAVAGGAELRSSAYDLQDVSVVRDTQPMEEDCISSGGAAEASSHLFPLGQWQSSPKLQSKPPPTQGSIEAEPPEAQQAAEAHHSMGSAETPKAQPPEFDSADPASRAELARLAACKDEELLKRLPQIAESLEALACQSDTERKAVIWSAMKQRDKPDVNSFRSNLLAKMDKIGSEKRQNPATSPLLERRVPLKPRKHKTPVIGSTKLAVGPQDVRTALWVPPASPFYLIEEVLYDNPWKLLVACMLLNKTTGRAVRKILWKLFEAWPTPEAAMLADAAEVEKIIKPLGLFRKRALMFKRFSHEYVEKEWTDPRQLHGIGQYAFDAYCIFCRNKWREMAPPQDKDLLRYFKWLQETNGEGSGFVREVFAQPENSAETVSVEQARIIDISSPGTDSKHMVKAGT